MHQLLIFWVLYCAKILTSMNLTLSYKIHQGSIELFVTPMSHGWLQLCYIEELSKLIKQRTIKQKDDKCQGKKSILGVRSIK